MKDLRFVRIRVLFLGGPIGGALIGACAVPLAALLARSGVEFGATIERVLHMPAVLLLGGWMVALSALGAITVITLVNAAIGALVAFLLEILVRWALKRSSFR